MRIPPADFRSLLDATEPVWRARLAEMFGRMHFILGEQVRAFESEFAAALGARHCVTVGNGTAALEIALRDGGIHYPAQEVIAPALTAPFTAVAIQSTGAKVRFADIDPETLLMDPDDAAQRATRATAAIVPVHLYGQVCDLARFRALARKLGAVMVQDACQAHGVLFRGKPLTEFSTYVAYSFYPTKNLGALGDGGAILTSNSRAAARMSQYRDGGRIPGTQIAGSQGQNSRLDEMQACYLRAFLPKLAEWNEHRAKIARLYSTALSGLDGVAPVRTSTSVWHLYVIRAKRRDRLREFLASHGIAAGIHYPVPLHLMPAFSGCGLKRGSLPHAEKACREILSLPLYPYLPESAAQETVQRIREFYGRS